jgi:hypothetical protein
MIETFTPFGVGSEYNWSRSGCAAGHFLVIGNAEKSVIWKPRKYCTIAFYYDVFLLEGF